LGEDDFDQVLLLVFPPLTILTKYGHPDAILAGTLPRPTINY